MHTIGRLKRVEESKWEIQPKGFNNNILWHAGHIFVTVEQFIHQCIKSYDPVEPDWIPLFIDGTSPDEWEGIVPTGEEVLTALRAQLERVIPVIENRLAEKADEPLIIGDDIMTIDSIEGFVQFLSWHEGTHSGAINAMNIFE
jgi:uncharacterized damage-inducible protein DinB